MSDFIGSAGNDTLIGTDDADTFDLSQGGDDVVKGRGGNDVFYMGAAFTADDRLAGGDGNDQLVLEGDYSRGVVISTDVESSIERVMFEGANQYRVDVVGSGPTITEFQSQLGDTGSLVLNGRGLRGDAGLLYEGGDGRETILGSAATDSFYLHGGLTAADRIDGREGNDYLRLDGDYSAGLVMSKNTLRNVENLRLQQGHDYDLTFAKTTVGAAGLQVDAQDLTHADSVRVDASKATLGGVSIGAGGGNDELIGGHADDSLSGGKGIDRLTGGEGADVLSGGAGNDRFIFNHAGDSTDLASDLITDLAAGDVINLKHIDADTTQVGNQAFHLVASLGGHAGELAVNYDSGSGLTSILGDVDGDGVADLAITATGDQTGFTGFSL